VQCFRTYAVHCCPACPTCQLSVFYFRNGKNLIFSNGASDDIVRPEGKREAGVVPARSRHCDRGALCCMPLIISGRLHGVMILKSGNLPFVGTGFMPDHEVLIVLLQALR